MNTAIGVVISVDERAPAGSRALIGVAARDVCRRCAEGRGCGAGVFGRQNTERRLVLPVPEGVRVRTGQKVTLVIEPRRLLAASLYAYGWPLAGMLSGVLAAYAIAPGDAATLAGAIAGLGAGAVLARRRLAATELIGRFAPRIAD